MSAPRVHGLLASFANGEGLLAAVRSLVNEGVDGIQAYAPCPVDGLAEALAPRPSRLPRAALAGGVLGGGGTFALQLYSAVYAYPINVGGRPDASWPMFLPPALEMALLGAALAAFVAMLWGNGLPQLFHPLFGMARFERASRDGYFMVFPCPDDPVERDAVRERLHALGAGTIEQVPA